MMVMMKLWPLLIPGAERATCHWTDSVHVPPLGGGHTLWKRPGCRFPTSAGWAVATHSGSILGATSQCQPVGQWSHTLEASWVPLPDVSRLGRGHTLWKRPGCRFPMSASWAVPSLSAIPTADQICEICGSEPARSYLWGSSGSLALWIYFTRLPLKVMCTDIHRSHWVSAAVAGCVEELKLMLSGVAHTPRDSECSSGDWGGHHNTLPPACV